MKFIARTVAVVAIVFVAVVYGCQALISVEENQIARTAQDIAAKYPDSIAVEDFQLDAKKLVGQKARVRGTALCISGDSCFLYQSPDRAMQSMIVDISRLSRDSRQSLLRCNDITFHPCWYVVSGIVENEFAPMLEATEVIQAN